MRLSWLAAPIVMTAFPTTASAQQAIAADQVTVPDLSFKPDAEAEKNYWKYNYFHKAGVPFETARTDLRECRLRSTISSMGILGGFVPYSRFSAGPTKRGQVTSSYGLVGQLLAEAIIGGITERNRRSNLRECMDFKGYRQYGLPKTIWQSINPTDTAMGDAIQAKIASGPAPTAESLK